MLKRDENRLILQLHVHSDRSYDSKNLKNFASTIQFLGSIPRFIKRRFNNFPNNLTK